MEFLVIWIASIITSYGISFTNILQVLKKAADDGYRVDFKKMKQRLSLVFNDGIVLIPGFNILYAVKELFDYNNCVGLLDTFRILELIDHMTIKERAEYVKNATGLNAYLIAKTHEKSLEDAPFVLLKDGSFIYYKLKSVEECLKSLNMLDSIVILKATSYARNLSVSEQKQIVMDKHRDIIEGRFEKYIIENLNYDEVLNNDMNCLTEEKSKETIPVSERIKELKNMKKEITSTNQDNEEINNKKVKTLK